jgi:predicted tellurium resistance membrane protein TerC
MQKWKILAFATAALLVFASIAVLADGADKAEDWWTEMTEHHEETHGDDFETHHQEMHGDDWKEHVADCHSKNDKDHMASGGHMTSEMGSMMGATMM